MKQDLVLAIDNGTQSVRALLFNLHGHLVHKAQIKLDSYTHARPGWMEHDPDGFWTAVCRACQELWLKSAIEPQQVRALVVTTQRGTVINLDKSGRPLRSAIIWADQRRAEGHRQQGHARIEATVIVQVDEAHPRRHDHGNRQQKDDRSRGPTAPQHGAYPRWRIKQARCHGRHPVETREHR